MAGWTSVTPTKKKGAPGPPTTDPVLWAASVELPPHGTPWRDVLEAVLEAAPGQVYAADPSKAVLKVSLRSEDTQSQLVRNGIRTKNGISLAVFPTLDGGWARRVHLQNVPVTATDTDITKTLTPAFGTVVRLTRHLLPDTKVLGTEATAWALLPKDAKPPRTVIIHGAPVSSLLTNATDKPAAAKRGPSSTAPTTTATATAPTGMTKTQPAAASAPKPATTTTPKPAAPPAPKPAATPETKSTEQATAPAPAMPAETAPVEATAEAVRAAPTTTTTATATAPAMEATAATEPTPTAAAAVTTTPTTSNPTTPATPETATATLPTTATPASQTAPSAAAAEAAKPPAACQTPHPAATVVTLTATTTAATATPPTVKETRTPDATTPSTAHRIVMRVTQLLTPPSRRRRTVPSPASSPYATASDGEGSPTPPPPLPRRSERIRTLGSN